MPPPHVEIPGLHASLAGVAEDGHVNAEDEAAVQNLLERQQGAWNMALVATRLAPVSVYILCVYRLTPC